MRNILLIMGMVVSLSACAPVANYKPYGEGSMFSSDKGIGYRETEISQGKWFVQYVASPSQSETDMVRFAVRRAAEVGDANCPGNYKTSAPTINSETIGKVGDMSLVRKTVSLTVACKKASS